MPLPGGEFASPYESWKDYDDASFGRHIASLRISDDGGETWPGMVAVAVDPPSALFIGINGFACASRNGCAGRDVLDPRSRDRNGHREPYRLGFADGRTWTTPTPTGWRGATLSTGCARRQPIGGHLRPSSRPPSLRIVLSDDFGKTWDRANEYVFYESGSGAEAGVAAGRAFEDFWRDMMTWSFGHPRGAPSRTATFRRLLRRRSASTSMRWVRLGVDGLASKQTDGRLRQRSLRLRSE